MNQSKLTTFIFTHRPFIYIQFHNIPITDENFEEYKKEYLELLLTCKINNDKIIPIINVNNVHPMNTQYVIKQTEFNKKIFHLNQKYLISVFIYCESKIFKELIKINMFIDKTAVPVRICRSIEKLNKSIQDNLNISFNSAMLLN